MSDKKIVPIVMPKWGLSMSEGKLTDWLIEEGAAIKPGDQILEVETDKIAGAVEAGEGGTLRLRIGQADTVYPVKALLGVVADGSVSDEEVAAFAASYVTPAGEDAGDGAEEAQYHFVDLDIGRIRYAKRGEGRETLILIHGFGGDLDNWLFNIDSFGDVATVHALDLPGHGQSVKTMPTPPVDGLAGTVLAFMDKLGIDKAHIAGHSLGGLIGILVAKQAPGRVKSLSLICSAGLGAALNDAYLSGFVDAASRKELKPVLEQLFADPNQLSRPMMDELLKYKRIDGVGDALRALHADMVTDGDQRRIFADDLEALGIPVLAIAGREDRIIPARQSSALRPKVKVSLIRHAGHMVQMEKYKTVNELVRGQITAAA